MVHAEHQVVDQGLDGDRDGVGVGVSLYPRQDVLDLNARPAYDFLISDTGHRAEEQSIPLVRLHDKGHACPRDLTQLRQFRRLKNW